MGAKDFNRFDAGDPNYDELCQDDEWLRWLQIQIDRLDCVGFDRQVNYYDLFRNEEGSIQVANAIQAVAEAIK